MTASSPFPEILTAGADGPDTSVWDAEQAAAAARGDADAFRRLVERHGESLRCFCHRALGGERDAEDVCQETFVRAWHALPRYREQGQFRPWLWRIALNLCRDLVRARRRRHRWLCDWPAGTPPEALTAASASPDEAAALRADLQRLASGLAALPEGLRVPLVLSAVDNLPHSEIASIIGLSLRAVDSRVFRARQRLLQWWPLKEQESPQPSGLKRG